MAGAVPLVPLFIDRRSVRGLYQFYPLDVHVPKASLTWTNQRKREIGEKGVCFCRGNEMSAKVDDDETRLTSFRDANWLSMYALNNDTVLDYFSFSPFYDRTSDNEVLKMQGLDSMKLLQMTGIQYTLARAAIDPKNRDKSVFVVNKEQRLEPEKMPVVKAVYYCIDGTFYQAPTLGQVLDTRIVCFPPPPPSPFFFFFSIFFFFSSFFFG